MLEYQTSCVDDDSDLGRLWQHLFLKRDKTSGQLVFCPERAKTFCSLLTDKVDLDHDGYISKEEFITGYSIWQVHIKKAEMLQMRERQASFIYKH